MKKPSKKTTPKRPAKTARELDPSQLQEASGGCIKCVIDPWVCAGCPND